MSMNILTSANSAAGNEGVASFVTFGNWVGGATRGQHTPVPTSPPTFIGQQGKKRRRSESDDDGYESDSESEAQARKTRPTYQLERYLSEESTSEERPLKKMRRIRDVIGGIDRLFGVGTGSPHSSDTNSSAGDSSGSCVSISRNTSTSGGTSRSTGTRSRSGSMSGSTGTVETGTLSDVLSTRGLIQVRSCPMNRYLSESRKESPILLVEMEWEGQAMSESDSPASDSLETDLLPRNRFLASPTLEGMLFLVHLFFFFILQHRPWANGITLCFSFDIQQYCAFYILQALMR